MISPRRLEKGDKVAVVSPAGRVDSAKVGSAIRMIGAWGYQVVAGDPVFGSHFNFAAPDEDRISDLQKAMDDPEVKAIFCARGGYGSVRIIDRLDFSSFAEHPKWIIGFSDITVFHSHIHTNFGIETIHGPMPNTFGGDTSETDAIAKLRALLSGKPLSYTLATANHNRNGEGEGILVGGNLSILCSLTGSRSDIDTRGKILFVEEVGENLYRIDRMMWTLKRAGKLKGLAGFIAGGFTEMKDNKDDFGQTAGEIIAEALREYEYPVCFGFPAGHQQENFPLILGRKVRLGVAGSVKLEFAGAEKGNLTVSR